MEVRIWQSFSCNSSGSYYLVARFDSAADAEKSAAEIRGFLEAHAKQKGALIDEDDGDWEDPSPIQNETAPAKSPPRTITPNRGSSRKSPTSPSAESPKERMERLSASVTAGSSSPTVAPLSKPSIWVSPETSRLCS